MTRALVIGGTRFVGRHAVSEFLDADYDVTIFNRGNHENPFADDSRVERVEGDRTVEGEIKRAALDVDPDVVVDCVAYHPRDVRVATEAFADADAYVYVSSGAAYGENRIPKREDETPLEPCSTEQATDDSWETYGPRKAEGDRAVFEAAENRRFSRSRNADGVSATAERGVRAMSVRPPVVYGPHDYTERFDYWIDRVENHDRVVVPGDGTNLWHLVYAGDVASAIRTVAEEGDPGEAYNVGDGHAPTLGEWVERVAEACDTEVERVFAGPRELSAADLELTDFPLYREYPHLLSTSKLRSLGWRATDHETTLAATVADHRESDRTGRENGPDREAEERVLSILDTV